MLENEKPLRHYRDSWWKVEGEPIWYLAGKSSDPDLPAGKWYFSDETADYNGPFDSRKAAELALKQYVDSF